MEIVIVPAWRRADFLHATLTRLKVADDGVAQYWLCLDRDYDPEVLKVARSFAHLMPPDRVTVRHTGSHPYPGNSYNLLTAVMEAATLAPDLVHLVEEDIFVGRDFFPVQRRLLELYPQAFSACAARNEHFPADKLPVEDDTTAYSHVSYQPCATSLPLATVKALLPHICEEYFADMVGYCRRTFLNSMVPEGNAEQDGLLHRLLEATDGFTVYPTAPRAYHAGFVGYNRPGEPLREGSLEDRSARLLAMSAQEMNDRAAKFRDLSTVDLDRPRAEVVRGLW